MTTLIAAATTVLGTLVGVFLGSYLQLRSRRDEWLRQDRLRWLEGRRSQYASFVHMMDTTLATLIHEANGPTDMSAKDLSALKHELAGLKLIAGSEEVVRVASLYVRLFGDVVICQNEMQLILQEKEKHGDAIRANALKVDALEALTAFAEGTSELLRMPQKFLSAARLELGLPELDPQPIDHPAKTTEKYVRRMVDRHKETAMTAVMNLAEDDEEDADQP